MSSKPTGKNLAARFLAGCGEAFLEEKENLSGDFSRLLQQIGSSNNFDTVGSLTTSWNLQRVEDLLSLKIFLESYQAKILLPIELPAVACASTHAARGEVREMIALDQQLTNNPMWQAFASASQQAGRAQLEQLRPLRDQRILRRYLAAVESGQAVGWHTVVYGLTLAIYSVPLRQGLSNYAAQTLAGFISAAARTHHFSEASCQELLENLLKNTPENLEIILSDQKILLAVAR